jgi:SAM-dependent methyltransferase
MTFKDYFSSAAGAYAAARPTYPPELFAHLTALTPAHDLAWDCGTGSGQAATALAPHFMRIRATDPSSAQIAQAQADPRVDYEVSSEGESGLPSGSADLVIAAQAAHWFDLDRFYDEVRRVLRPDGVIAIWCYGNCRVTPEIDAVVIPLYEETLARDWPPEREHIEAGYTDLHFPFDERPFPDVVLEKCWTREEFLAYLGTWSAVTRYRQRTGSDPMTGFRRALEERWGGGERHIVRWPLPGRLGIMSDG